MRINDLTTTPEAPPEFRALEREGSNAGRDMRYPPGMAEAQRRAYPGLEPLRSDLPPDRLFELVQAAALEMPGWEIAAVESARRQMEAVAISPILRYRSDVVIQVRPEDEGGASVHVRSKTRRNRSDFGGNARRIRAFLRRLSAKLD